MVGRRVSLAKLIGESPLYVAEHRPEAVEVLDGELYTREKIVEPKVVNGMVAPDLERDILPICVLSRYEQADPALAFVRNFGLKRGAIASSVAHDSHNIVAAGADFDSLAVAINAVIEAKGGIAVADEGKLRVMPLPIAGLMSPEPVRAIQDRLSGLIEAARALGSPLDDPFMALSFLALPVIPALKITDRGLVDVNRFEPVDLFVK